MWPLPHGGAGGGAAQPGVSNGNGGAGLPIGITGFLSYYAGGGAGGTFTSTVRMGGIGGGGNGGNYEGTVVTGSNGVLNTGGGGGGAGFSGGGAGGAGGSGIVIIRYPGPPIATGGTITSVDGDTIHTFTETGSHTFTVF